MAKSSPSEMILVEIVPWQICIPPPPRPVPPHRMPPSRLLLQTTETTLVWEEECNLKVPPTRLEAEMEMDTWTLDMTLHNGDADDAGAITEAAQGMADAWV